MLLSLCAPEESKQKSGPSGGGAWGAILTGVGERQPCTYVVLWGRSGEKLPILTSRLLHQLCSSPAPGLRPKRTTPRAPLERNLQYSCTRTSSLRQLSRAVTGQWPHSESSSRHPNISCPRGYTQGALWRPGRAMVSQDHPWNINGFFGMATEPAYIRLIGRISPCPRRCPSRCEPSSRPILPL